MSKYENETVISLNDAETEVRIFTMQAPFIRRIREDDRFTVTDDETHMDGGLFAVISREHWTPWGGLKRRLSEAQRQAATERLRSMRSEGAA